MTTAVACRAQCAYAHVPSSSPSSPSPVAPGKQSAREPTVSTARSPPGLASAQPDDDDDRFGARRGEYRSRGHGPSTRAVFIMRFVRHARDVFRDGAPVVFQKIITRNVKKPERYTTRKKYKPKVKLPVSSFPAKSDTNYFSQLAVTYFLVFLLSWFF